MIEIIVLSCLALTTAAAVLVLHLHRKKTVEELIRGIARIDDATRNAMELIGGFRTPVPQELPLDRLRDLAIFWWNSRLFVQISNELMIATAAQESAEVNQLAARIRDRHKELLKLVVVCWWERLMENVLRIRLGQYQAESISCYADAEDSLRYLIAYWRPESESILGEKI